MRTASYPLMEWGWTRSKCIAYIRKVTGAEWRKSCCKFCPFADGNPEIMARYREFPETAAEALLLEHVALALNPLTTLYRDRTLRSDLEADENVEALRVFNERLVSIDWALYRVRRIITRKGGGDRSVEKLSVGSRLETYKALFALAKKTGIAPEGGRVYLSQRQKDVYPTIEEFYVAAPALADAKSKPNFGANWKRIALPMAS